MPEGAAPDTTTAEVIVASQRIVACDGGNGMLGHPRVFMTIMKDRVMCPYCSRIYVLDPGYDHGSGH